MVTMLKRHNEHQTVTSPHTCVTVGMLNTTNMFKFLVDFGGGHCKKEKKKKGQNILVKTHKNSESRLQRHSKRLNLSVKTIFAGLFSIFFL